jgi:hypothetical protein
LEAHSIDLEARQMKLKREQLLARAKEMVDESWQAIERAAETLWSKPWQPKHPHRQLIKGKSLSGSELVPIVAPLHVVIDESIE